MTPERSGNRLAWPHEVHLHPSDGLRWATHVAHFAAQFAEEIPSVEAATTTRLGTFRNVPERRCKPPYKPARRDLARRAW